MSPSTKASRLYGSLFLLLLARTSLETLNLSREVTILPTQSLFILKQEVFQAEMGQYQWSDGSTLKLRVACTAPACQNLQYILFKNKYVEISKFSENCHDFPFEKGLLEVDIKFQEIDVQRFQESVFIIDYSNICRKGEATRGGVGYVGDDEGVEVQIEYLVDLKKKPKRNYFYLGRPH